jgi:nitric oxide reductase NorQ protein
LAMENGDWVVLDEINMARPEVVSVLHQVLDHRRALTIKEHNNEEVKAHPDFRVFGTMNPEYAGTAELNYAFRRRFELIISMNYLSPAKEKKLIMGRTDLRPDLAEKCVKLANDTRKLKKDGKLNYPLSTAHILEFSSMLKSNAFAPLDCARVTLNVSDDIAENEDVMNCVKSYF